VLAIIAFGGSRRRTRPTSQKDLEDIFYFQVQKSNLPTPNREYAFSPDGRRWRFDFAWPELKVAVEIEGGTWTQGRHTRGQGFEDDCVKHNTALMEGWKVLRFPARWVKNWKGVELVKDLLG